MVSAEKRYNCIDEQVVISSLSMEFCCRKMKSNYKQTEQQLNILLEDSKGRITPTMGGRILINTIDEIRLAGAIVEEVKYYFGNPDNKPKNTAVEALIIDKADDWFKSIKRGTNKTSPQYADFVVKRAKREYAIDADRSERGDTATTFKAIVNAVERWAETKRKQPKAKKAKEHEPREAINQYDHFCSTITEDQARRLFELLTKNRYINGEVSDWLICCGVKDGTLEKRINWLQGLNELAYFIMIPEFTNEYKWSIAKNVFSWQGKDINPNSIRTSANKCIILKSKRDALDEILGKVLKNNFVVNNLRNI